MPKLQDKESNPSPKTDIDLAVADQALKEIEVHAPQRVSGFSLKSIQAKKKHQAKQKEKDQEASKFEIHEAFTEDQLLTAWNSYAKKLQKRGHKILGSILLHNKPKLKDTTLQLEFANQTMKKDLERGQGPLMAYLKKELRNTDLELEIKVNSAAAKKYAFTPLEKYNKLKEKNPLVEKLKDTFGLDI